MHALARHAGADRQREVHVIHRLDVLLMDHAGDLGALLGGQLGAGAGLACGLRTLIRTVHFGLRALVRAVHFAGATPLINATPPFAAFRLHVLARVGAAGLTRRGLRLVALLGAPVGVGGALGTILRALAGAAALHVIFRALVLHRARLLLLGLAGLHAALLGRFRLGRFRLGRFRLGRFRLGGTSG